ncbi:hypothetical protein CLV92_115113 [Kineococcus xinjiangensis]|uniref:Pyrroloquinoline-quinone binding quinoprotein n=1 Tax=Kineococcus xinjiangensis TaxID=512762 RepID=A0A2S6IDU5_9ACTN|nr:hypothetical protein CLV92_115113 [Kineococcus xinjiangensis]
MFMTAAPGGSGSAPSTAHVEIAPGVRLEPGPSGELPVSLQWVVVPDAYPEAVAVDDGVVYIAGGCLHAFRLSDGALVWRAEPPDGNGLVGSGWVIMGTRGVDEIRALAPSEYDITVKRSTGQVVDYGLKESSSSSAGIEPFPHSEPERFLIEAGLEEIVARGQDGSIAWKVLVDEPMIDELPPVGVPGGVVLTTSSGHVLKLGYLGAHS